jgi:16S rRNA G966 N2-methylase RsmD
VFDIVFLDPPFGAEPMNAVLQILASRPLLAAGARVYLEYDANGQPPELPAAFECARQGRFGGVGVMLAAVAAPVLQSAAT